MKRHLIAASCVALAAAFLSSCQKEDKSVVELANELTAELQQVNDSATANAHAARVKVLNRRFQDASVRVLALNDTALLRGAGSDDSAPGSDYAKALTDLAREMGRVRAGFPSTDGEEVDPKKLLQSIAVAQGKTGTPDELAEAGESFMKDENTPHDVPGEMPEYFSSESLKDALAYRSNVTEVSNLKFDSEADVPALPELGEDDADAKEGSGEFPASSSESSDTDSTSGDTESGDDQETSDEDDGF